MIRSSLSILAVSLLATVSSAAPFAEGNLVVLRIGDNATAPTNAATPVFLDELTPAGVLIQSIAVPATGAFALTNSGTATSEGSLQRSGDGRFLTFAGYRADAGTAGIASSNVATVPRVGALVNAGGVVDTTTLITDAYSANNVRSAVTLDGTGLWFAGANNGVRFQPLGQSGASITVSTGAANLRTLSIQNGQLFVSSASGTLRLGAVGSGVPNTTDNAIAGLPGFPTGTLDPYSYFFSSADQLWVADARSQAAGGGLLRFRLVGGNWVGPTAFNTGLPGTQGLSHLTGVSAGSSITIYAVSGNARDVVRFESTDGGDTGAFSSVYTNTTAAPGNFRGIALAPTGLAPTPTPAPLSAGSWALYH